MISAVQSRQPRRWHVSAACISDVLVHPWHQQPETSAACGCTCLWLLCQGAQHHQMLGPRPVQDPSAANKACPDSIMATMFHHWKVYICVQLPLWGHRCHLVCSINLLSALEGYGLCTENLYVTHQAIGSRLQLSFCASPTLTLCHAGGAGEQEEGGCSGG